MSILGIDVATPQRNLDFGLAFRAGYRVCYVKLGGDNIPRYVAPYYAAEVDKARAVGFRVGHYWVPNLAKDAAGAADYFCSNLRGWNKASDFVVLDNESLDGARLYGDDGAAAFVTRVKERLGIGGRQVKVYLGLADARSYSWAKTLATGCDFIISAYSYAPFMYSLLGKIPADRNGGHQYSSSGNIGGVEIDLNSFRDWAFDYGTVVAGDGKIIPLEEDPLAALSEDEQRELLTRMRETHRELVKGGFGNSPGYMKNDIAWVIKQLIGVGTPDAGTFAEALKFFLPILPDLKLALNGEVHEAGDTSKVAEFLQDPTKFVDQEQLATSVVGALRDELAGSGLSPETIALVEGAVDRAFGKVYVVASSPPPAGE